MEEQEKSQHIKMEIIQCFRDEQEKIRQENKDISKAQAVIESKQVSIESDNKDLRRDFNVLQAKVLQHQSKNEEIERRLTKHSEQSEKNYNELKESFAALKTDFSDFKGQVFKRLDVMTGRDSVLKIIGGAALGGMITTFFKVWGS